MTNWISFSLSEGFVLIPKTDTSPLNRESLNPTVHGTNHSPNKLYFTGMVRTELRGYLPITKKYNEFEVL